MQPKKFHYTKKFLAAYAPVEELLQQGLVDEAKLLFRKEMLALGHEERIRNLYRVQDKLSKRAVFFVPNEPQEKFLRTKKGRDIILKIRQVGFTTMSGVRGLDKSLFEANTRTGIMAHQKNVVDTIFEDIVKFSYDHFLNDWGHLYRPVEASESRTELSFKSDGQGRDLHSSMRVLFDFRGKTVHFLHVSEASRVENERLVGSLNGVPANGEVILESTAQGRTGEFFRQWQNWKKGKTLAPYKGHFIPWYEFYPEQPSEWTWPEGIEKTPYEKTLQEELGLKDCHLAWRRWAIEANCEGKVEVFDNEYPTNDIDCFLTGDAQVFSSTLLKKIDRNCRPPTCRAFLLFDNRHLTKEEHEKGPVEIWEEPQPGSQYVIGADPSSGVGRDRGAMVVKNRNNKKVVAVIAGQFATDDYAHELFKLGRYYNMAWLCIEENNHGHAVIQFIKQKNYPNLYRRAVIDEISDKPTKKIGFLTTNDSKIRITEQLNKALKHGDILVTQPEILDEMTAFIQVASKTGRSIRREASGDAHDDLVIATSLAEEMDESLGEISDNEHEQAEDFEAMEIDESTGFAM